MEGNAKRKLAAVMFTDIEGYTALVSQDEEQALRFVRQHRTSLTKHTEAYSGEVIEFYGDGSLSIYDSAIDAVRCAIEMQKDYRIQETIPVRIGIHLGDINMRDGSVFGNGINVASRIESIGVAGNILISEQVQAELINQTGINTKSRGKFQFKNVKKPIEVFAIDHPILVIPTIKDLRGGKGKRVSHRRKWWVLIALFCLAAIGYYFGTLNKGVDTTAQEPEEEKIAVPPFKNLTGQASLDYIGDMAGHWLTKELIKTNMANVVAFQTNEELMQLAGRVDETPSEQFSRRSGAISIIDGTYMQLKKDSFEFSSFVKRLKDGAVAYSFGSTPFSIDNPQQGIFNLSSKILGYWNAKDDGFLSMPSFGAYKSFMKARNLHLKDNALSRQLLKESISLDSSFLDPYFLLISNYYNEEEYANAQVTLNKVNKFKANLTQYELNIFNLEQANLNGENIRAYEIAKQDISQFDRDFFTTTEYMIYALENVNDAEGALAIYKSKNLDELPLSTCAYCKVSRLYAVIAHIRLGQYKRALALLKDFPPNAKTPRYFSFYIKLLAHMGHHEAIKNLIDRGKIELGEDFGPILFYIAARECDIVGDKNAAKEMAQEVLFAETSNAVIRGWAHYFLNDNKSATKFFTDALTERKEDMGLLSLLGVLAAKEKNTERALSYSNQILKLKSPFQFGAAPYFRSRIFVHLDQKEQALDLLEEAFSEGAKFYANNFFSQDPVLKDLFKNPRFIRITNPMESR